MAVNGAIFTTSKHDLHRLRKSAPNPVFSKRSILKFQPIIRDYTEILCRKFAQYKENDQVLPIGKAFSAFAGDISRNTPSDGAMVI
jgi:cytochrome P450